MVKQKDEGKGQKEMKRRGKDKTARPKAFDHEQ